ncbi:islet cell autoantigen 1 [Boleophthalmus pectinirostris]|uniref:islet cell autoantigen 1 n=1 Tax=Boleophthalmus pectinirostris TaxID=150288 RepID=UPI00242BBDA3|nr:islet cell autoantigen 1 [Boleophthalmus pectinirostris]
MKLIKAAVIGDKFHIWNYDRNLVIATKEPIQPLASAGPGSVSVLKRFQQRYWRTKQSLITVTGQRQDEHVVASDSELDAKLEVFHSIQRTCMELLKVIEQYQKRICVLSQEEAELGRFLRSQASQDKSRAGKIMQATGKALCFSSQQRLALRAPLVRLFQEVETFRYRAISDTWLTVNRMEQSRTEYRGALLWMKDVSQELDPDTHKHMDKFRRVQAQVRSTKSSFDRLKHDVCQKVDMLGASRCNLLSHLLTTYQTTLLHFWEKTSRTMAAIHESFKGSHLHEAAKDSKDRTGKRRRRTKRTETQEGHSSETTDQQLISLENENPNNTSKVDGDSEEVDSVSLLNEILGPLSLDGGDWTQGLTEQEGSTALNLTSQGPTAQGPVETEEFFLPSELLEQSLSTLHTADWTSDPHQSNDTGPSPGANKNPAPASREPSGRPKHLSAWLNLFADLDPLSNPDAIGNTGSEHEAHNA